jgi:hypothetical protein
MHYCGRTFTVPEIELIRALIASDPPPSRYQLSRAVCEHLGWRRPDGHLKDMSCRVALLRMQADGLLTLPQPRRKRPGMFTLSADLDSRVCPPPFTTRVDLDRISIEPLAQRGDSRLWNAYVERHHYLGHELIPGAQLRYFVRCAGDILALLSFGASAWKIKPRDAFIGWSDARRREKLHLIVNNARFLILPWVSCRNLASRILALVSRRLPQDWLTHYGYRPVLLETFVEKTRFTGTCYKAANWLYLGDTQGRGKLDTLHRRGQPIKSIWVYPLTRNFRQQLCNA